MYFSRIIMQICKDNSPIRVRNDENRNSKRVLFAG